MAREELVRRIVWVIGYADVQTLKAVYSLLVHRVGIEKIMEGKK